MRDRKDESLDKRAVEERAGERFRELAASLPDYVIVVDRELRYRWYNRLAEGLTAADLEGAGVRDFVSPEDFPRAKAAIDECFETGRTTEYTVVGYGDGDVDWVYENRVVPYEPDGEALAMILTRNVTERVKAERRFSDLLESSPDFILTIDQERRITYVNRYREGVGPDDVLGQKVENLVAAEARDVAMESIRAALEDRRPGSWESKGALTTDEYYSTRIVPFEGPGDARALVTVQDISDRVRAERAESRERELQGQLEQMQRLESLGVLAGGIAHDFNNLLMVVSGSIGLAQHKLSQGCSPAEELEQVVEAVERASELTRRLLAFGRRSALAVETVDIRDVVEQVAAMARRLMPRTLTIDVSIPDHAVSVRCDKRQLEQVLVNLCINARDAMPSGGVLNIDLTVEDQHCVIATRDSGTGIAKEDLPYIFEPFFTTKEPGKGTGVGLALVNGIVQQHEGTISVESDGRGTTFSIRLPVTRCTPSAPNAVKPPPQPRGGRILVAEDNATVLATVERMLRASGFEVVGVEDGDAAVAEYKRAAVPSTSCSSTWSCPASTAGWPTRRFAPSTTKPGWCSRLAIRLEPSPKTRGPIRGCRSYRSRTTRTSLSPR